MKFYIRNPEVKMNCLKEIQALPFDKYHVEIKEAKRTLPQNSLYWKWLSIIGDVLGYSQDELHQEFASRFLGVVKKKTISGKTLIEPISTASLTKKDFTDYLEKIAAFSMAQDITLPTPEYYGYGEQ